MMAKRFRCRLNGQKCIMVASHEPLLYVRRMGYFTISRGMKSTISTASCNLQTTFGMFKISLMAFYIVTGALGSSTLAKAQKTDVRLEEWQPSHSIDAQ